MTTTVIKWKLNQLLADRRKTSRELATHLGIHENSVYRLKKEDQMPRLNHDTLNGICEFLGCQPGELLEWIPNEMDSQGYRPSTSQEEL